MMDPKHADNSDDEVQFLKVEKKPKSFKWVASTFGDFGCPTTPSLSKKTSQKTPSITSRGTSQQSSKKNEYRDPRQPEINTTLTSSRKRPRASTSDHSFGNATLPVERKESTVSLSDLWSERHKPSNRSDLVLHKKKVEEITDWLTLNSSKNHKHPAPMLLLMGPPGAGKTACVQCLCREIGLNIQEWENNNIQAPQDWSTDSNSWKSSERSAVDVYTSQSQSALFQKFLLRASKYTALNISSSSSTNSRMYDSVREINKPIVLVEDLPNIFYRDNAQFHEILRKYSRTGNSPLVFIMSESNSGSSSIQKLFPKDLQNQLKINVISVNPVAPTALVKQLNKIVAQEAKQRHFRLPDSTVVDTVAMSSSGDIRAALNSLQFACTKDTMDLKLALKSSQKTQLKKKGSGPKLKYSSKWKDSETADSSETASAIGVKDGSVFLFHALGKILYFKRGDPKDHYERVSIPPHLKSQDRDPLLVEPEVVVSKSHVSGDYFSSFLHENYVEFFTSVEDLERATEYFSDADFVSGQWLGKDALQNYSVSIATRGFIHSNSDFTRHDSVRKNQGWRPLQKSQWFNTWKQAASNVTTAGQLFRGYHWDPEVLCTEILPYINLTNPTLHDAGQINFVHEMCQFSNKSQVHSRLKSEGLGETDVLEIDDDEITGNSSTHLQTSSALKAKGSQIDGTADDESTKEDVLSGSQSKVQVVDVEREEEVEDFVIEEFDD